VTGFILKGSIMKNLWIEIKSGDEAAISFVADIVLVVAITAALIYLKL
jgi:hypothetical protein